MKYRPTTRLATAFFLLCLSGSAAAFDALNSLRWLVSDLWRGNVGLAQQPRPGRGYDCRMNSTDDLLVACLCAAWCKTCTEFRGTFDKLSAANPGAKFVWVDVEDDSALVGDIEIENFPTLAVFRGDKPLFYGVTMPQEGVVVRTLSSLQRPDRDAIEVPAEIAGLPNALGSRL